MGVPNLQLLSFFSIEFNIRTFVETGSGHGETVQKAIKIFPEVHTIELADRLYEEVSGKFGNKAHCHHGPSVEVLRETILPTLGDDPVVYWLDAHYSGGPTAGRREQCPLLRELGEINQRRGNNDFIIIDDAHVFFSPAVYGRINWLDVRQWPDIQQVFEALNEKPRYVVILSSWRCVAHGVPDGIVMPENAIVAVPEYARDRLYDWLCSLELEH
jgi:hypothetical protein